MKKICKGQLLYCGSEGISITKVIRGLSKVLPGLPPWEQLKGRVVLPTFLGRVALQQLCEIWQLKSGDEILMPAYNCGTEIDPFLLYGCKIVFYRVDERARIDVMDIMRRRTPRTKVVYVTHYFGWSQDLRELIQWCNKEHLHIVEDCALALFSSGPDGPLGLQGDAAIFSLGKFLPLPAAGLLTLRQDSTLKIPVLREGARIEMIKRTQSLIRKDLQRQLERVGLYSFLRKIKMHISNRQVSEQGIAELPDMPPDYYFDESFRNIGIPRLSLGLLGAIDPNRVAQQRRENYLQIDKVVKQFPDLVPLSDNLQEGVCPLVFPIIVKDRSAWAGALQRLGIGAYSWWEGYHRKCSWEAFAEARYLKDHLLCLPVNQGLGELQMAFIGQAVTALRLEMC
jgi:dTDP-4-amino-4,6-dideoxygalactose transaminase